MLFSLAVCPTCISARNLVERKAILLDGGVTHGHDIWPEDGE
jgi:hypothetical protein